VRRRQWTLRLCSVSSSRASPESSSTNPCWPSSLSSSAGPTWVCCMRVWPSTGRASPTYSSFWPGTARP
ncbi:hypothetical protein AAFF_G00135590, partial [Aldrovandia affinis]